MAEPDITLVEFRAVIVDGRPQTYDIFINGKWHGSRNTEKQCREYVAQLVWS